MNKLYIGLILILFHTPLLGQSIFFSGKVTDATTLQGLPGVLVKIVGREVSTLSQADGTYRIELQDGYENLTFSLPGYKPKTIFAGGKSGADVILQLKPKSPDQVKTGFGQQSKEELSGSISSINTDEVSPAPLVSLEQSSQGMATGLMVQNSSGKLGGAATVRVRGGSTLSNSNNPLYVVDGVPLASGSQSILNPDNIASIEILKDASAAAIYGSRAANGVIIITTKSGEEGGLKVDVDYQAGVSQSPRYLNLYTPQEYNEQLIEFLIRSEPKSLELEQYITKASLEEWAKTKPQRITFPNGNEITTPPFLQQLTHNTDWQREVLRTGLSHKASVGVSGGQEVLRYYASVGYNTQEGILVGNAYDRLNASLSLDSRISEKLSANMSVNFIQAEEDRLLDEQDLGAPLQAMVLPPSDGYSAANNYGLNVRALEYNPLTEVNFSDNIGKNQSVIGSLGIRYDILDNLSFNLSGGADLSNQRNERRQGPETREGAGSGRSQLGINEYRNYTGNAYFTFSPNFGEDHKASLVAGVEYQEANITSSFRVARVNGIDQLENLAEGDPQLRNPYIPNSKNVFVSSFWRLNYAVYDRFHFQVSGRVDGSSKFAPDNRYGFFPAVSASWLLSKEPTVSHLHFMDLFKFKASYGIIGNTPLDDFLYRTNYYQLNYGAEEGLALTNFANRNLKWESTSQLDVGFEFSFINRISGSFDYYVKKTTDLLFPVPVSLTSGTSSVFKNLGSMENVGLEINLSTVNLEQGDFSWTTDFNISFNDNLVTDLKDNKLIVGPNAFLERQPAGVFYLRKYVGVDPESGQALYDNGDGGTTTNWEAAPRQIVGNPNPGYFGGLTNTVKYKNFDLSFLMQFVGDVDIYYATGEFLANSGILNLSQLATQTNRWYNKGDQADYPVLDPTQEDTYPSSRWVQNGQYARLKNLTLTYSLPESTVSGWGLHYMKVYIGGQNLWTLTSYEGFDPDVNYTDPLNGAIGQNISRGLDNFTAPQPRIFMAGVKLGF